jgi:anti-sigma B factor antagonist
VVTPSERTLHTVLPNVLVIRGEVDLASCHPVSRLLLAQLNGADGKLRLDLSEVTFFAAVGVRMLLEATDAARRRGVTLRIDPLSRSVSMALHATGAWDQLCC